VKWPLNSIVQRLGVALAVVPAIMCGGPTGLVCTEVFATYTVVVTDTARAPVAGASLVVTLQRTGASLTPQSSIIYPAATYLLLDDGARPALRETGDEIHAVVSKAESSVEADYLFDVPGRCHIHKVSGPDSLVLPRGRGSLGEPPAPAG
jgi:hypothetical protein